MTDKIKKICVFASATNDLDEVYYKDAARLGKIIAENNYGLVYGGSRLGLMYACAESVKNNGGHVTGVMPKKFEKLFGNSADYDEFYVTEGIRERKAKLDKLSDAVIAVAGGFGTLEEVTEMIVQKQLSYSDKPIVLLNTAGFYNTLTAFFDEIIKKGFAPEISRNIYFIANTPEEAIEYIKNYKSGSVSENMNLKFSSPYIKI